MIRAVPSLFTNTQSFRIYLFHFNLVNVNEIDKNK